MSRLPAIKHGGLAEHVFYVRHQLRVFRVHQFGVVPGVRVAVPVDQELLEVPGDVAQPHGFVEQAVGLAELGERWPTRFLHVRVDGDLVLPVDVSLLKEVLQPGLEPAARPHVPDAVEQLLRRAVGLLLAELVAGVPHDDQFRVLLCECIYLDVGGLGQTSVGGDVEDQHGLALELVVGDVSVPGDGGGVELVDG